MDDNGFEGARSLKLVLQMRNYASYNKSLIHVRLCLMELRLNSCDLKANAYLKLTPLPDITSEQKC
jgi:hypothetical protein